MNEIIKDLVEYFRKLSFQHKEVYGYMTGEEYEQNMSDLQYPLIWFRFPINGIIGNNSSDEYIELNLTLGCYTNLLNDEFGNQMVASEHTTQRPNNQIEFTSILPADDQINTCFRILSNFEAKVRSDVDDFILKGIWGSSSIQTKARIYNNDVNGAELLINLRVANPYRCDLEDIFITNP